ncbi:MAG TPA: hypothetical protein VGX28_13405 [Frankiaceae bacterium]|jgi:hypothetical protein|nr:hypothetical protein [Frankiaceae bacterium]
MRLLPRAFVVLPALLALTAAGPAQPAAAEGGSRPVVATISITDWGPLGRVVEVTGDAASPDYSCFQSVGAASFTVRCVREPILDFEASCELCPVNISLADATPRCARADVHATTSYNGGWVGARAGCQSGLTRWWTQYAISVHGGPHAWGEDASMSFPAMNADVLLCEAGSTGTVGPTPDYAVTCAFSG